jgi:FdhD protein
LNNNWINSLDNLKKLSAKFYSIDPHEEQSSGDVEIANDEPICIHVNGEYLATLVATPEMLEELAAGYLLSLGVIKNNNDISSLTVEITDVHVDLTTKVDLREASLGMMNLIVTACSSSSYRRHTNNTFPRVSSTIKVKPRQIVDMMRELNKRGRVYNHTRGTHSAMICSDHASLLSFSEDVGRHNAVDKVIGAVLLEGASFSDCLLLSTGRQSGEMVLKAAKAGIPLVASMTVPLVSGIRMAEKTGITLVSLIGGKLCVYSVPDRVVS